MSREMIKLGWVALGCGAFLSAAAALAFGALSTPANDWTIAGPFGGTARSLAIDPKHPSVLLAGGMNSLVFRTTDGGANWRLLDFPKRNLSEVTSLLVDPNDSNHYFAGMISAQGGGLFESDDEGRTWVPVKAISKVGVRALTSAPSNGSELLAGTLEGVYLSKDSGKNWKRISDPENLEMQGITVVAVDSKNPDIIYAGTSHLPWKTLDGGKSWQSIHTGMIDDSDVFSVFVDPANPSDILASACSGIYASTSRGDEWKKLLGIPNTSRRTHVIREEPGSENVIYAGTTTGLYKSLNHGGNWKTLTDTQANTMVFDPSTPGRIYLALEYDGIGKSDNGGENIQLVNHGFVDRAISAVARAGDKLVAIETQEGETSGIFISSDRGENWNRLSDVHGLGGAHLKAITGLPSLPNTMLAATPRHLFKTTDAGNLWKPIPVRLVETLPPPVVRKPRTPQRRTAASVSARTTRPVKPLTKTREVSLAEISALYSMRSGTHDLVFAATNMGLLKSSDAGEHWILAKIAGAPSVSALYFDPQAGGRMIVRSSAGLFISRDCGENWNDMHFPLASADVNEIAIPSADNRTLLAATRLGIYTSPDEGVNWFANPGGIPASTVTSVLFSNVEAMAYAVEYGRLYATANAGKGWKEVPTALPTLTIRQLWMPDLASGRLYGITSDLGILFRDGSSIR